MSINNIRKPEEIGGLEPHWSVLPQKKRKRMMGAEDL
jgi:hypothetical protein